MSALAFLLGVTACCFLLLLLVWLNTESELTRAKREVDRLRRQLMESDEAFYEATDMLWKQIAQTHGPDQENGDTNE